MIHNRPSHFQLPEYLRLLCSLLAFLLFTVGVYLVLLLSVGSLCLALPDADSRTGIWLRQLPRNLNYRSGQFAGFQQTRLEEVREVRDVDLLAVGSSHAYRGLDPRIFQQAGLTLFNLGSSAQTHLQTGVLLRRHLNAIQPRMVIYEAYPGIYTMDGVESALDLINSASNDLLSIRMALAIPNLKVWNTLIYALFREWVAPPHRPPEARQQKHDTYIPGGFVEYSGPRRSSEPTSDTPPVAERWRQQKAFEDNLQFIREAGIPVLLVRAPHPATGDRPEEEALAYARRLGKSAPYVDANDLAPFDVMTHFYDSHHLNQRGVARFNQVLIDFLSRRVPHPPPSSRLQD
jgi:hypothetical protein